MLLLAKKLAAVLVVLYVVLLAFVYVCSPYFVRYVAQQPLADLGLRLGDYSTVRYNLFSSTISVRDLRLLDKQNHEVAAIDAFSASAKWSRLLFKRLYLSDVSLSGGQLSIDKNAAALLVAGVDVNSLPSQSTPSPTLENEAPPTAFTVFVEQLLIQGFALNSSVDGHENRVLIDSLLLNDMAADAEQQSLMMTLKSRIDGAKLNISTRLSLANRQGNIDLAINLDSLALGNYSHLIPDELLDLSGSLSLTASPKVRIAKNTVHIALTTPKLRLQNLDVGFSPWLYNANGHTINGHDIDIRIDTTTNKLKLDGTAAVTLDNGQVAIENPENVLVNWQTITLNPRFDSSPSNQRIGLEQMLVENIELSKLSNAEPQQALMKLNAVSVNAISFVDKRVTIDSIQLDGGDANLHILEDKSIANMVNLAALSADTEATSPPQNAALNETGDPSTAASAITMSLGGLRLSSPFNLKLNDSSVAPAVSKHITLETLQVGMIDTALTDNTTAIDISLKDQGYFRIDATAGVKPFSDQLNAQLKGKLSELSLTDISPYMGDSLGFEMKSGQLDLNLDMAVSNDELSGNTHVTMRGLEMTGASAVEQNTLQTGQAMPLNVALGLLKDSKGNIDLKVPISGNVASPSFGIGSFIQLIVKKAAMNQAKNYLMQTFVPYANVVKVAMTGADYLLKIRLEPLPYQATQTALSEPQQEYLTQLTQLLIDKPELHIKTCAVSTPADINLGTSAELRPDQTHALLALGHSRQQQLKAYLVEQGTIASSRILSCAPTLDRQAEAVPHINLEAN